MKDRENLAIITMSTLFFQGLRNDKAVNILSLSRCWESTVPKRSNVRHGKSHGDPSLAQFIFDDKRGATHQCQQRPRGPEKSSSVTNWDILDWRKRSKVVADRPNNNGQGRDEHQLSGRLSSYVGHCSFTMASLILIIGVSSTIHATAGVGGVNTRGKFASKFCLPLSEHHQHPCAFSNLISHDWTRQLYIF